MITRYNSKTDIFALGLIYAEMVIVMTNEERKEVNSNFLQKSIQNNTNCQVLKIFHSFRCGTPNNEIFNDEDTVIFVPLLLTRNEVQANFVRWMANTNNASRPTCNEILNSISFETMI